jgi:ferric-dicitrate binding protein FerR (iron transport regulator)
VLGVHFGGARAEIDAAYLRLALQLNPERHPQNAAAPRRSRGSTQPTRASSVSARPHPPRRRPATSRSVAIVSSVLAVAAAAAYFLLR